MAILWKYDEKDCVLHNLIKNSPINFRINFGKNWASKMAAGGHFEKSFKTKQELCIDLKWLEIRSKVIFGHPKWPPAAILWTKLKNEVRYWSEMREMQSKVIICHSKWPPVPILWKMRLKVLQFVRGASWNWLHYLMFICSVWVASGIPYMASL